MNASTVGTDGPSIQDIAMASLPSVHVEARDSAGNIAQDLVGNRRGYLRVLPGRDAEVARRSDEQHFVPDLCMRSIGDIYQGYIHGDATDNRCVLPTNDDATAR